MHAVYPSAVFDASYAPEILIFRFARWPSLAEQRTMLKDLIAGQHLQANSSALLNIAAVEALPDPDGLADALAQAASRGSAFKRIACVVDKQHQAHFVEVLRMMAPQPNRIGVFFSDAEALKWLVREID